jgi:hypothetical protein
MTDLSSVTVTRVVVLVVIAGIVPLMPPPDQVIRQVSSARSW